MSPFPDSPPTGDRRGHCPTCSCTPQPGFADYADDPRWRLANAELSSLYPELDYRLKHVIRTDGLTRQLEIELLHELGFHGVRPPSFGDGGWRSPALTQVRRRQVSEPPAWEPKRHGDFWRRIVSYQVQISVGRSPREAVELLAASRREWHAAETAGYAEWLRDRHANRARLGAQRYLKLLKSAVMAAGGPCTYCGVANPRTVDHIVPTTRGGVDHPANLTIACGSCNSEKNNQTPEEWKARRLAAGFAWPPPRSTAIVRKAS